MVFTLNPRGASSERLLVVLDRELVDRGEVTTPCVGEHHVEARPACRHHLEQPIEVSEIGDVATDRDRSRAERLRRDVEFGLAAAGDVHPGSLGDEPPCRRQSNSRARPGHQCRLAVELSHD
jgi:hypothetical protein